MITTSAQKVTIASTTQRGPPAYYMIISKYQIGFHKNPTAND